MSCPDVIVIGEPLIALVGDSAAPLDEVAGFSVHETGSEVNVAVGLARLGTRVGFIGSVGDDPFGRRLTRRLRGEGVAVDHLRQRSAPTALLARDLRAGHSTEVLYYRSGSAGSQLCVEDIERAERWITTCGWLHVSGITPALGPSADAAVRHAVDIAVAAGVVVSLDINLRLRLWTPTQARISLRPVIAGASVVFTGAAEMLTLTDASDEATGIARLHDWGASDVVVTSGADGAAASVGGTLERCPAERVDAPVDTVGAGDAFVAGYLWQQRSGGTVSDRLRAGTRSGAFAVRTRGDLEGQPRASDITWSDNDEPIR